MRLASSSHHVRRPVSTKLRRTSISILAGKKSDSEWSRNDAWILLLITLVVVWVHGRAIGAFFSSPEDFVHLQQGIGLKPVVGTPFRYLSQVLYFRLMVSLFGLQPIAFHAATLLVHALNACLVYAVGRQVGIRRPTAALAASLFGSFPLFNVLVAGAVGMNDEIALTLGLLSVMVVWRPWRLSRAVATALFVVGMLCKESVIALPIVGILCRPSQLRLRIALHRLMPLIVTSSLFALLFAVLRPIGLAPDRVAYATGYGANLFHNLMTYMSWSVNLASPIPDLVSSFDPNAWKVGLWVLMALVLAWRVLGKCERAIGLGFWWFLLGIAPVLPLLLQTYRHYLYPALPGLAIALAAAIIGLLERLLSVIHRSGRGDGKPPSHWRVLTACAVIVALLYGMRARALVIARTELRVAGTELAMDPVIRRREVAFNALASLAPLGRLPKNVAILQPVGTTRVFGARSGSEYARVPVGQRPYNLLEESLDQGDAIRLFYPEVDSVVFLDAWSEKYRDFDLFVPHLEGTMAPMGTGPGAHIRVAQWLARFGYFEPASNHLKSALTVYPADRPLRLVYGQMLIGSGQKVEGARELRIIAAVADSSGVEAQRALRELHEDAGP